MDASLNYLAENALETIRLYGYLGLFLIMMLDNIGFPIPSEIVLPVVGYISLQGAMNLYLAILVSATGSLLGGVLVYYIGKTKGRKIISKLLISERNLIKAENWFKKYGHNAIFFARLIPFVGKAVSFPAGVAKMDSVKYISYSYAGYLAWSSILIYLGYAMLNL